MITLRLANKDDAKDLVDIYSQYIDTQITFEYDLPSVEEFSNRISEISRTFPYLVCEIDGLIKGYAYAHKFRERTAYQWSVELSIYLSRDCHSKGIGKKLYRALIDILKLQGVQMAYSGVTMPNPKSEGLHEALGFQESGVWRNCGYKCNSWHSVKWYELEIGTLSTNPQPIISIGDISKEKIQLILESCSR